MSALEVLQAAQLGFVSPTSGSNGENLLRYADTVQVNVTWHAPYELTTLELWRGPSDDGTYVVDVLAANRTQDQTTYLWQATEAQRSSNVEMYFRLQKGDQPNDCEACAAISSTFRMAAVDQSSESSSTTASSTPMASSTPTQASSVAATTPGTAAAASASGPSLSNSTKLGIGLGVGLGGALVIALLVILLLLLRRRQQRREQHERHLAREREPRAVEARSSTGTESWFTKSSDKTKSFHGPFDFEDDGAVRPGSERLFEHPVTPQRMPSVLKRWR